MAQPIESGKIRRGPKQVDADCGKLRFQNSMSVSIHLASMLRAESGGEADVELTAATVREALDQLEQTRPAVYRCVCDETGAVRPHIHLFVNSTLVLVPGGFDMALDSGDVLSIMTAVSGG
jgi:molybdopterin converting factor small subunit